MIVSKLASVSLQSPHCTRRTHTIDTITIHCFVGQVTAERGVYYFYDTPAEVSANYVVGYDGSIGCSVPEEYRSYCSSNRENDDRAITIEVASDTVAPYRVTLLAMDALIDLLTDICSRYGITLRWQNDEKFIGQTDRQNVTLHRWFTAKECPGEYIISRLPEIVEEVNQRVEEEKTIVYDTIEEVPDAYRKAVQWYVDGEALQGTGRGYGLTPEMCRVLTIVYRAFFQ